MRQGGKINAVNNITEKLFIFSCKQTQRNKLKCFENIAAQCEIGGNWIDLLILCLDGDESLIIFKSLSKNIEVLCCHISGMILIY